VRVRARECARMCVYVCVWGGGLCVHASVVACVPDRSQYGCMLGARVSSMWLCLCVSVCVHVWGCEYVHRLWSHAPCPSSSSTRYMLRMLPPPRCLHVVRP
jgi:hypothetical protein